MTPNKTTEFFTDAEIETVSKAVRLIVLEMENLSRRVHDFSKPRFAARLSVVQDDIEIVKRAIGGDVTRA